MQPARSRTLLCLATLSLVATLASGLALPPASAHEQVDQPPFVLIVGWTVEPAVVGSLNGLDLGVVDNRTGDFLAGVESNLTATLSMGPYSVGRPLEGQFGRPGWYTFDVIPTRDGVYSVRLQGTVNTTNVDVTVDLDPVVPASAVEFPVADPTAAQLELEITGLRIQMTIATGIGVVGIAFGVLALAWVARIRRGRDAP